MGQLRGLLMPVLGSQPALQPVEFVRGMTTAIAEHTRRVGIDLNPIIMMGWGEAQTNEPLKTMVYEAQTKYREAIAGVVAQWQKERLVSSSADPHDVAQMLMSLFLGSIAQQALLRDTEPEALVRGFEALRAIPVPPSPKTRTPRLKQAGPTRERR